MKHRIDPLIEERAEWLFEPRTEAQLARKVAEHLLSYDKTLHLARQLHGRSSDQIMKIMASMLARNMEVHGLHNIPSHGPALIVANHPTGIADGIFLYQALRQVRPDMFFYANSDILRVLPQMSDIIVPVEWRKHKRSHAKTRMTLQETAVAMHDGRLGVIFPSGRLAKRRGLRLHERDWMPSAAMIARKFDVPVIPVRIEARNSALFYLFDLIHPSLRDITLFHETLNKDRQPYRVCIGAPIEGRSLPAQSQLATEALRRQTLELGSRTKPSVSLVRTTGSFNFTRKFFASNA